MFTVKIRTANAAFADDSAPDDERDDGQARRQECARILRQIANALENGQDDGTCHDVNGNSVGGFQIEG